MDILNSFYATKTNFELVENTHKLTNKLRISKFPTTLVIDKNGFIIDYYNRIDHINFEEIIKSH